MITLPLLAAVSCLYAPSTQVLYKIQVITDDGAVSPVVRTLDGQKATITTNKPGYKLEVTLTPEVHGHKIHSKMEVHIKKSSESHSHGKNESSTQESNIVTTFDSKDGQQVVLDSNDKVVKVVKMKKVEGRKGEIVIAVTVSLPSD